MAKRRVHNKGAYQQDEAVAGEAGIYPGMLLQMKESSGTAQVIKHDTSGSAFAEALFAAEDALQGKTVDDVYTSGKIVTYLLPGKGSVVNARIAGGQNIHIGDLLVSNGAGCLIEVSTAESYLEKEAVVAVAMENCDNDASGAVSVLSAVRVV